MQSRLVSSARLASRLASTSNPIHSRVAAAKLFALSSSRTGVSSIASTSSFTRSFASTPFVRSDKPVDPLEAANALPNTEPTQAEEEVAADRSDVDPLASTSAEPAESAPVSEEAALDAGVTDAAQEPEVDPLEAAKETAKRTVFVGGLSWNVDNEWLRDEVAKVLENPEAVVATRVARNPMGKSKGFAFIELASPELALQLSTLTAEIDHRTTEFRLSNEPTARQSNNTRTRDGTSNGSSPRNPPSETIWVGNLAWTAEETELAEAFEPFGAVKRVSIPRDHETGRARGIGYVEFSDRRSAEAAMEAGSQRELAIMDRPVKLDYAATQRPRPSNSGKAFGSGRGGAREGRGGYGGAREGRGGYGGGRDGGRDGGRQRREY